MLRVVAVRGLCQRSAGSLDGFATVKWLQFSFNPSQACSSRLFPWLLDSKEKVDVVQADADEVAWPAPTYVMSVATLGLSIIVISVKQRNAADEENWRICN